MKRLLNLSLATCLIFGLYSCKKDEDTPSNHDSTTSQDNNKMESSFDDVYEVTRKYIEEEVDNQPKKYGEKNTLTVIAEPTVTVDDDTIIVDYGTGISGSDGKYRTGKVYIHYTGGYRVTGTKLTTTLENYTVDGVKIEGKKVVENLGEVNGKVTFSVKVTNGKATYPDGSTISNWNSERTRVWVTDNGTALNPFDDIYKVHGTATGVNRQGTPYSVSIPAVDPLYIDIACWLDSRMPKDGIIYVTPEGLETRSLDYGTGGACDRIVTFSVGSFSIELSL